MSAPVRTDVHRPSSPDFNPADYECHGVFDLHPEEGNRADRARVVRALVERGIRFGGVHPSGQCDHCGTHLRYEALMVHVPTQRIVTVGETCLDERFLLATRADFKALRAAAAAKSAATREAHRAHATAAAAVEWLREAADPLLIELSYPGNGGLVDSDEFLSDLARSLYRNGELTPRQEAAAAKAARGVMRRNGWADERAAADAARRSSGAKAPTGRTTVTGEVQAVWLKDSAYGSTWKFRVLDEAGFVVIGTVPNALLPDDSREDVKAALRGRRVSFAAALQPHDDDPSAAWLTRPTRARFV